MKFKNTLASLLVGGAMVFGGGEGAGAETMTPNLNDGLKAYWKMDETSGNAVIDSVDGLHNGMNHGAVQGVEGLIGTGYDFKDSGNINLDADMYNGDEVTVSMWVKLHEYNDNSFLWWLRDDADSNPEFRLWYRNDLKGIVFDGYSSGSSFQFILASGNQYLPDLDEWSLLVAQSTNRDGGQARLWIDGNLIAMNNGVSIAETKGVDRNTFGYSNSSLNASLDEVAWWDRYLDEGEIAQLYNDGNGVTIPEPSTLGLLAMGGLAGLGACGLRRKRG